MKYRIKIEGGFVGTIREYNGEIFLKKSDTESILKDMTEVPANNENLRDGLLYNIELEKEDAIFHKAFDEGSLPLSIRNLIDHIRQKE